MLTIKKSTTLSGEIKFDGTLAVSLQANISNESRGNTYINQTILNQDLYNANKAGCRSLITGFQEKAYEIEDAFLEEKKES